MIQSVRGKLAEQVMNDSKRGFPSGIFDKVCLLFTALQAATELRDLRFPQGNRLHALGGDRLGQHSISINKQWRICFTWTPQGPENVEIVDYH